MRKEREKYSSMLSESYELDFASILNLKIVVFTERVLETVAKEPALEKEDKISSKSLS